MQAKKYKDKISDYQAFKINQDMTFSKLNCHNIGRIIEFDPDTQLCTVEMMYIIDYRGQQITPVPITEVPLIIYGAQNGHITLPNPVGSICLLLFLDRNIDKFKQTGEQYTPGTTRMHDFTDCVALTTFKTLANPLENYDERAVSIFNNELIEEITYDSLIKVYGNQVFIQSNKQGDNAQNASINLAPSFCSVNIDNGASIYLDNKVNISNQSQNLHDLIQSLILKIQDITINSDTMKLTQGSVNALETVKTNFGALLKND